MRVLVSCEFDPAVRDPLAVRALESALQRHCDENVSIDVAPTPSPR